MNAQYDDEFPATAPTTRYGELAAAFAKAQAEMHNPGFDSTNPHFRNRFASLAAVRNAVVPALAKHGIAIWQDLQSTEAGIACTTILTHSSGQQMRFGPLTLPATKADAQGFGSAATYARRYSLMAVAGVVGDDDDDANAATGKPTNGKDFHDPRPDTSEISEDRAREVALQMIAILDLDVEEHIKALKVLDKHHELNKNQLEYIAAGKQMTPKQNSAWKAYKKLGEDAAKKPLNQVRGG